MNGKHWTESKFHLGCKTNVAKCIQIGSQFHCVSIYLFIAL